MLQKNQFHHCDSSTQQQSCPRLRQNVKIETGKSTDEGKSCKVCLARSAKLAKSTEVPLVVMPEAASYARALTALLKVTSTPLLSSTPSSNLSSAFAAKSSAVNMKSPSSRRRRSISISAIALRSRQNVSITSKTLLICQLINRVRSLSLPGNLTRVLS